MLTENELEMLLDRKQYIYEATVTDELGGITQRPFDSFSRAGEWVTAMETTSEFRIVESSIKRIEIDGGEKRC